MHTQFFVVGDGFPTSADDGTDHEAGGEDAATGEGTVGEHAGGDSPAERAVGDTSGTTDFEGEPDATTDHDDALRSVAREMR